MMVIIGWVGMVIGWVVGGPIVGTTGLDKAMVSTAGLASVWALELQMDLPRSSEHPESLRFLVG